MDTTSGRFGCGIMLSPLKLFRSLAAVCILACFSIFTSAALQAQTLPTSFVQQTVVNGLVAPVNIVQLPGASGQMLVLEKLGRIRLFDPSGTTPVAKTTVITIPNVDSANERGLASIALDPAFTTNGYFYVYYTHIGTTTNNRVSRFTFNAMSSTAAVASELLIWENPEVTSSCCHYGGGLDFGPDGTLYLATGEEFDGLQSADLTRAGGKIIRLNTQGAISGGAWVPGTANTHIIPVDNPSFITDGPGGNLDEIWAYGLRNPYRMHWDMVEQVLYIGEVGGNIQSTATEDIHVGRAGAHYGWPNCEGVCNDENYDDPIFSYPHSGAGAAITAGVVYRGGVFPSSYDNVFFYGDYARNEISYLSFNSSGDVSSSTLFGSGAGIGAVVAFETGSDGALYTVDYVGGTVNRIIYDSGNQRPVITSAQATSPVTGPAPLNVSFTATATDAEMDPLTYTWEFGDGSTANGANVSHSYTTTGNFQAFVRVTDGQESVSLPIAIQVGVPPSVSITQPVNLATFRAGDSVAFQASGSDSDGVLQASSYSWNIEFTHNAHTHPAQSSVGQSGVLVIGNSGHSYNDDTGYRLTVTITDSDGLTATDSVEVKPEKVEITFSTVPAGIDVFLDGLPLETPINYDTLIDFQHTVSVPDTECVNGTSYQFASWSDSGARTHLYTVPTANQSLQAIYTANGPCSGLPTSGLVAHYAADDGVILSGAAVIAWEDQSAEGNDLNSISGPPTIAYNEINGLPAISLDGNLDYLARVAGVSGTPVGAQDRTIYLVGNYINDLNGGVLIGSPSNNQTFGLATAGTGGGNLQIYGFGNDLVSTTNGFSLGWMIESVTVNSNFVSHYVDGSLIDSGTRIYNTALNRIVLGANTSLTPELRMDIAEVLIYDRALTNAERLSVDAFLQNKYFSASSNTAPLANNDSATTTVGNSVNISVLTNDSDADGTLVANSVNVIGTASNGSVVANTDGSVTYTHNGGAIPFDSFQYTVDDDDGATSNVATVSLSIGGGAGGGLPTSGLVGHFESDIGVTTTGNAVTSWQDQSGSGNHFNNILGAPQLIASASENLQEPAISFDGVDDVMRRTVGLAGFPTGASNRTIFMIASYESVGSGGFGYGQSALNQAFGLSINGSGTLRVNAFGSAFDSTSATAGTNAGWLVQSAVVNSNQMIHFVDGVQIDSATRTYNTQAGDMVLGADLDQVPNVDMQVAALLVYNRALNAAELQDVQVYLQNKYFAPSSSNNPPNAVNDSGSAGTAGSTVLSVLGNDTDIDGTLVVGSVLASTPANGTAVVNANGTITYTHNGSATTGDSFTYTVEDDDGAVSNTATVSISITGGGNQVPVAANDTAGVAVGGSLAVSVLVNDSDPDGTLVLGSVAVVSGASSGTAVANANGTITYTHTGGTSTSDTFQYTVQDDQGATSNTATVTMTIGSGGGPNQAPVANDDNATVAPGGTTSSQPLPTLVDSGSQTAGTTVTVTDTAATAIGDRLVFAINTGGSKLTTANGTGWTEIINNVAHSSNAHPRLKVFQKTATASDVGGVTHSFTIDNGGHRASWALVRVKSFDPAVPTSVVSTNGGNNNLATYTSPALTGVSEDALLIDFVAAATDNLFPWSALPNTPLATVYSTTQAFLAHNLASSFKHQGAVGTAIGDTYSANDNARYVAAKLGFAPLSVGGSGNTVTIFILSNDSDSDGTLDPSSVAITSGASNGTTVVNGDGSITYTHDGGASTSDSFQYTVDDNDGATSNAATVNINIGTGANQPPVANADSSNAAIGGSVSIAALSNDTDADGTLTPTSVVISTAANNGTASANTDGTITYTHNGGVSTSDTFQYTVEDDLGAISNVATVTVTISSGNQAPVAADDGVGAGIGGTVVATVLGNDSDTDGSLDPASVVITTLASNGTAMVNANGTISYTHDGGASASDTFQYTVNDDQGLTSNVATVTVTITVPGVLPSAGLVGHYEADALVTSGVGSVVSAWGDQSGSGNDLAGGGDPTLIANTLNGNPVIDFDGVGDILQDVSVVGLPVGASDRTMYMVASYDGVGYGGAAFGANTLNSAFGLIVDTNGDLAVQGWGAANDAISATAGTGEGWLVQSAVVSGNTLTHYQNGGLIDTQARTYNTTLDRLVVGSEISGTPAVDMQVAAIIIYDRALTAAEQLNVQNYLQAKYFGIGNVAPVANDDSDTVPVGSSVTTTVLSNDSDVNGSLVPNTVTITTAANNGTVVANTDGTITYTHDGGGSTGDTYQYTVNDDQGASSNIATVTISVTGGNQAPVAANDSDSVPTGGTVMVAVLGNDSDVDGSLVPTSVVVTLAAANGTATVNTDGTITYVHDGGSSTSDTIQYTVNDDQGATSNVATVTILVTGSLPASGLVGHYEADMLVTSGVGGVVSAWGDQSSQGNTLGGLGDPTVVANALNGNPVIDFDGTDDALINAAVTGLPAGASDRTMYMVVSYGGVGYGGAAFGTEDANEAFGLIVDASGDLTIQGWGSANDAISTTDGTGAGWLVQSALVSSNTLSHYLNGGLIDTQSRTYNTAMNKLVVGTEIDGAPAVDMQVAAIIIYDRALTVAEQLNVQNYLQAKYFGTTNLAPTAADDSASTTTGGTVMTSVLGNDSDADGTLVATSVTVSTGAANGTVTANTDGTITYVHDGGASTTDTYQYTVDDDQGATSNVATVTVTITGGGNQSPTAVDDTESTTTGGTVMTSVLGNDSDADGTLVATSVTVSTGAANGTVTANTDGTITYVHNGGASTTDTYQYTVDDDQGATSNAATVTVTILGAVPASGLVAHYEADQLVTTSVGNVVTAWGDQSAQGNDLAGLGDPALLAGVLNGNPVVNLDGVGDSLTDNLTSGLPAGASDRSMYMVVNYRDTGFGAASFGTENLNEAFGLGVSFNTGNLAVQGWGAANDSVSNSVGTGTGWLVQSAILTNDTLEHYRNGNLIDTQTRVFNTATNKLVVGAELDGDPSRDLQLAALLIYDRALTAAEQVQLQNYLQNKYFANNQSPVAVNDSINVISGGTSIAQVLVNDSDADGSVLPATLTIVTPALNGTALVNSNGTVSYTHGGATSIADSFQYVVNDNQGVSSNVATVSVAVAPNVPPVANDDNESVATGATVAVTVLANDSDTDGTLINDSIVITTAAANGTVTANPDGTVSYVHDGGISTTDLFTYTVEDNQGAVSNAATVSITVTGVANQPPVAANDSGTVPVAGSLNVDVLTNDTDIDGTLVVGSVLASTPANGTAVVNANGTITYTHNGSATTGDSFTYTVEDDDGAVSNTATVSISITGGGNQVPVAANDTAGVAVGGSLAVSVLVNDSDPDGTLVLGSVAVVSGASSGTAVANANGTITYTHTGGTSTSDTFQYTVQDDQGATSNTATVTMTIGSGGGPNQAPVANDDNATVAPGGTTSSQPLPTLVDSGSQTAGTTVTVTDTAATAIGDRLVFAINTGGSKLTTANGTGWTEIINNVAHSSNAHPRLKVFQKTATASDVGGVTHSFTIDNGGHRASWALVRVKSFDPAVPTSVVSTNGGNNNLATYTSPALTGVSEDALLIDFVAAATDNLFPWSALPNTPLATVYSTTQAFLAHNLASSFKHQGAVGTAIGDTYSANDNARYVAAKLGFAPLSVGGSGNTVTIFILSNDSDSDGTLDPSSVAITSGASNGTTVVNGDGSITYTHDGGASTSDSFQYTVDDNDGATSNAATVNINIGTGANQPPVANADSSNAAIGGSVSIAALSNDTDADGTLTPTSVVISTAANNGTASANTDGTITYTHNGGVSTSDTFQYTVEDDLGAISNVATVTVTISSGNQAPVAADDGVGAGIGGTVVATVLGNDSDTDGSLDPASVVITTLASNGTAMVNANGTISYTHDGGASASDTFQYTVNDDQGLTSNVATVTVTITVPGVLPSAGLVGHYEADALVTSGVGSVVSAWGDQSGSGNDLAGGGDPTLIANTLNGNPVIDFDGVGDILQDVSVVGLPVGASDRTMYMVASYDGVGYGGAAFGANTLNSAFGLIVDTNGDLAVQGWGAANDAISATAGTGEGWLVQSAVVSGNTLTHYQNGGLIDTQARTYNTTLDRLVVGSEISGTPAVDMQVAAIIIYDRALTAAEQLNVQNYLQAKYFGIGNVAPVANDDSDTVPVGSSVTTTVLSNDSDVNGSLVPNTVTITTAANNGTVVANTDGTITYTHDGGGSTGDTYQYTVNDDQGASSNIATVTISVTGGNQAPVAANDSDSVPTGGTVMVAVLGNDSDVDGSLVPTSVVVTLAAANGTATVNTDGTITYVHDGGSSTSDTIQYTVNDDQGATSNVATVTILVTGSLPASGLVGHYEADMLVTSGVGGVVSAWGDQSSQGNTLGGLGDPTVVANALNGNPVIDFDGTDDALINAAVTGLPAGASDRTMYMVVSYGGVGYGGAAFGTEDANEAFGLIVDASGDLTIQGWGSANDAISTTDGTGAGWLVQSALVSSNTLSHYLNGGLIDTQSRTYNTAMNKLVVGTEIDGAPAVDMQVAAIIIYDRALTVAEQLNVQNYLQAKYFGTTNLAPTAADDSASTTTGGTVMTSVLGNDSDADGTLVATSVTVSTGAANGTVTANTDGTITYVHDGGASTTDTYQYTVDDDQGATSNVATVTVTITGGGNQSPTAVDDTESTTTGGTVMTSVLGNDSDADGTLVATSVTVSTGAANGTVTANTDGTITYVHNGGASTTDTYQYTVDDDQGATSNAATVTVTITSTGGGGVPVASGLVAHYESDQGVLSTGGDVTTWEDQSGNANHLDVVLGDPSIAAGGAPNGVLPVIDFDGAGDALSRASLTSFPSGASDRTVFMVASYESVGSGGFNYGLSASNQAFGLSVASTGVLRVNAYGGAFDKASSTVGTNAGWMVQSALVDSNQLTHFVDGAQIDSASRTYNTALGSLVLGADLDQSPYVDMQVAAILVYDRALSVTELAQIESYLQNKYFGGGSANQSPTAADDSASTTTGGTVMTSVLGNDSDADGTLVATSVTVSTGAANGTVTANTDGTITYVHDGGASTTDTYQYTVDDDQGATSNVATVTVTITGGGNQSPTAVDDTESTTTGGTVMTSVLGNDSDADGTLVATSVTVSTGAANGTVTANTDGTITYVHNGGASTTDTYQYTVDDDQGATSNAATVTVTITSTGGGGVPVASGLVAHYESDQGVLSTGGDVTTWEDQSGNANHLDVVLGDPSIAAGGAPNGVLPVIDFDGAGDALSRASLTSFPSGASDRTVFMVASYESVGSGGFNYGLSASNQAFGLSVASTGVLRVNAYGGAFDKASSTVGTNAGWMVQSALVDSNQLTHFVDGAQIDSASRTYNTALGSLVLGADLDQSPYVDMQVAAILVYDRALSVTELAQIESYLQNKYFGGGSANQSPTAADDSASTTTGGTVMTSVLGNDSDADGTLVATSVTVSTGAANGTVTANTDGTITYVHDGGASTTDTYQYTVDDDQGATSNVATVTVTITGGGNQSPTAVDDTESTTTGGTVMTSVLGNDSDADGTLVATSVTVSTGAANGTVTANTDGTITYVHNGGASTTDTYQYTVDDDQGATSNAATVTVTITSTGGGGVPVASGLVAHYESDQGVLSTGGDVTTWEDQSGNANHLDVVLGDPSIAAGGAPNGVLPVIDFDGAGDALSRASLTSFPSGASDRTVFMVASYESVGSGGFNYGLSASNQAFGLSVASTGVLRVNAYGGAFDKASSTVGTNAGWMVQSALVDSNQLTHFVDGAQIDSASRTYNTALGSLVLGADLDQSPYVDMQVAAILVYDRALSVTELAQIESYLQNKYF